MTHRCPECKELCTSDNHDQDEDSVYYFFKCKPREGGCGATFTVTYDPSEEIVTSQPRQVETP